MPGSLRVLAVRALVSSALLAFPTAANAADLCDALTVPDGIGLRCQMNAPDGFAEVAPSEGPFAAATSLWIWPLGEPVDDDDAWLRRQVTLDLSGVTGLLRGFVSSEDSPFFGGGMPERVDQWVAMIETWGNLPLAGCGEPEDVPAHDARELRCVWRAGPLEQHLAVRLVHGPNGDFGMTARATNPTRIRHLEAIANSFVPGNAT
jgi:hypothetical protein